MRDYHLITACYGDPARFAFKYAIVPEDKALPWTWISRDLGPVVAALFSAARAVGLTQDGEGDDKAGSEAGDALSALLGKSVPLVSFRTTFEGVLAEFEQQSRNLGLGKRSYAYEQLPGWGQLEIDEMNRLFAEYGLYEGCDGLTRDLERLGVKTGTLQEFVADYLASQGPQSSAA